MSPDLAVIIRTLIMLLFLLFVSRILGRRTLSELTFYDFVIGLILGHIGGSVITAEFSIRNGAIALMISTLWVLVINMLTLKSIPARKLIEAEPLLVINKGLILEGNLKKRYYNVNHLLEMLREQSIFDPSQVEIALIESDGQLSVLKKPEYQNPTNKDFSLLPQSQITAGQSVCKEIIIDGKVIESNLASNGLTRKQLESQLNSLGITDINNVMLAMITPEGKLYIDKRKDSLSVPQQ